MRRAVGVVALLVVWAASSVARADECASYGPRAFLSLPGGDGLLAENARFEVGLFPACGGFEGGPPHAFRLTARGKELAFGIRKRVEYPGCEPAACEVAVLTPEAPLSRGEVAVEVRQPVAEHELGEWEVLGRFVVGRDADQQAPWFAGIVRGHDARRSQFIAGPFEPGAAHLRRAIRFKASTAVRATRSPAALDSSADSTRRSTMSCNCSAVSRCEPTPRGASASPGAAC
jgi:hypothetical protein